MRLSLIHGGKLLRLTLDEQPLSAAQHPLSGYVDVGESGRLIGVEFESDELDLRQALAGWLADPIAGAYVSVSQDFGYIELSAPDEFGRAEQVRSVPIQVRAETDECGRLVAISIPRRGAGYEISYPSGNR